MSKRRKSKEKIKSEIGNQELTKVPYISNHLKEKIKKLFEIRKIPKEKIIYPIIKFNPKKGIKIILGENEINNIPHFINWLQIHGFIAIPKKIEIKNGTDVIKISSLGDIEKLQLNPDIINKLKLFTNLLAFGGRENLRNGNIFLGNFFLNKATHLFDLRLYFEKTLEKISRIYKRNYVEKDISEILFAETILNFILGSKYPEYLNYSAISVDLATFNEDHHKKIDHIIRIINTKENGFFEYDIQITVSNAKRKNDTLKIKAQKDILNPYLIISLHPIFQNIDLKLLRTHYEHFIKNRLYLKKAIGGNFFPYFFRNLPEGLVKGLKEAVNGLLYFLVKLSNGYITLNENAKIELSNDYYIIIENTPQDFKNFKNQIYFIKLENNGIPISYIRYIKPTTT